jgi:hypothetical protein
VEPPVASLEVGQRSRGVRILDVTADTGGVRIAFEAPAGTTVDIGVRGNRPSSVEGGEIASWNGSTGRVRVVVPSGEAAIGRGVVVLRER